MLERLALAFGLGLPDRTPEALERDGLLLEAATLIDDQANEISRLRSLLDRHIRSAQDTRKRNKYLLDRIHNLQSLNASLTARLREREISLWGVRRIICNIMYNLERRRDNRTVKAYVRVSRFAAARELAARKSRELQEKGVPAHKEYHD